MKAGKGICMLAHHPPLITTLIILECLEHSVLPRLPSHDEGLP